MNKNIRVFLLVVLFFVLICSVSFINGEKKVNSENIDVNDITTISILNDGNESKAAKLIKSNIVKVVNNIDDKTKIVGTGFFIKEGYLITSSHIVDIKGDIFIEYSDGSIEKAYLYSNSINYDIALLKVENVKVKSLVFGSSNSMEVTNDVLSAGFIYNFAGEASISKGSLSARRNIDTISYLQSDISIDTGGSGGPLFNSKAEVIAINTFVTENRTFALSLTSENILMIIDVLLEVPNVEYLTDKRPSNSINSILVEVGYTDDQEYDLYNDEEVIKKVNYDNGDEEVSTSQNKVNYYCADGWELVGKTCVRQTIYEAQKLAGKCKDGYILNGKKCEKQEIKKPNVVRGCADSRYKLTSDNKCIYEGYQTYYADRKIIYGYCPEGKKCYEFYYSSSTFVDKIACPSGSITISNTDIDYVWSNEQLVSENRKHVYVNGVDGILKKKSSTGLIYYENNGEAVAINCSKGIEKDSQGYNVHKFMTFDELKDVACKEGTLATVKWSGVVQGFYCKLKVTPKAYYYDVTCNVDGAEVWQEKKGSDVECRVLEKKEAPSYDIDVCDNDNGYYMENGMCVKNYSEELTYTYKCENNDSLNGTQCFRNEIKNAYIKN